MSEDILDRFTDPVTKRKRMAQREEKREAKRRKEFLDGKYFACDFFNEPPSAAQLHQWRQSWKPPAVTPHIPLIGSEIHQEDEDWLKKQIGFTAQPRSDDPFAYIEYFATAVHHCQTWLQQKLNELGWSKNETGQDPVLVSYSVSELLFSTWQTYHMAVKQIKWIITS